MIFTMKTKNETIQITYPTEQEDGWYAHKYNEGIQGLKVPSLVEDTNI